MIKCHIIFNKETDLKDEFLRCVESLQHPDVLVIVHKFETSDEHATPRRIRIHNAEPPDQWFMFADPDDVAVQPGYSNFIEHIKTFEGDVTYPYEIVQPSNTLFTRPHHLIAVRNTKVSDDGRPYALAFDRLDEDACFREVAYQWNIDTGRNTAGGRRNSGL